MGTKSSGSRVFDTLPITGDYLIPYYGIVNVFVYVHEFFKESFTIEKSASRDPFAYPKTAFWRLEGEKSTDCCFWDGVECEEETGHVISLDLSSSFLYGHVDSNNSLFNLVQLRRLNLADNHFNYSHIPSDNFKHLSRLTYLNLSKSHFSGQIPWEISTLSELSVLDLSFNVDMISGEKLLQIKEPNFESLIQNLTSLEQLSLSYVNILSPVPDLLANFSSLTSLLRECGLIGEFPVGIFELPNLQTLSVRFNQELKGKLPVFKQSSSLNVLKLASTSFSGDLPSSIENLQSLNELDINACNFSGVIPFSIGKLNQLTFLDLFGNRFRGQVPSSLSNLTQITYLSLSSNDFSTGNLSWVENLTKLTYLSVRESNLTGLLPSFLGNLTQLTELKLQTNQLTGPIPGSFARLTNLEVPWLHENFFSGEVNFDMFLGLKNLSALSLSDNRLSVITKPNVNGTLPNGTIAQFKLLGLDSCNLINFPDFLRRQERLDWLYLGQNQIHGLIPKWMLNTSTETLTQFVISQNFLKGFEQLPLVLPWTNLEQLTISSNKMEGPLPIPSPSTIYFDASSNYLTGEVQSSICNLRSLQGLDLSSNRLSGELPQCLGNFSNSLSFLRLSGNSLNGSIPQTFLNRSQLMVVDLSDNKFQGQLPRSLANCTMLKYLVLENNQLTDVFPYWLGALPELQILVLRSNGFHGVIGEPHSNSEFPKLRIIDISYNSFAGKLPYEYIKSWKAMEFRSIVEESKYLNANKSIGGMSLNYNFKLTITTKGVDRYYEKIQDVLAVVDLSSNKFEGEVPTVLGNLKGLHSLDLSKNKLTGGIPTSLGNLKELESLDLSQNKLSGGIPQELTRLTFLQYFNVSHNCLTGPIPQENQLGRFESTSYEGNLGLCGIPLQNKCGNFEASEPSLSSALEEESGPFFQFGWKVVVIGYGCGFVVGLFIGQIVIAKDARWKLISTK
ncbi:LRR domain containing protein [Parasponia andersonii]|uniref:LRR domain containing protein n=1 Tax=Parasponia andersonii TaxID=3476 RepID=A0A2P5E5B9_PARAD|nr:LRR domain containing protein [Parasponia andersonii]